MPQASGAAPGGEAQAGASSAASPTCTQRRCCLSTLGSSSTSCFSGDGRRSWAVLGAGVATGPLLQGDALLRILPTIQVPHALAAGCVATPVSSVWGSNVQAGLPWPPGATSLSLPVRDACHLPPSGALTAGTLHNPDGDSPQQPKGTLFSNLQKPARTSSEAQMLRSSPSWR